MANDRKILAVIDASNMYLLSKKVFGGRLNYPKLVDSIGEHGKIHRAIAYGAEMNGEATRFRDRLHEIGIETKYKDIKIFVDADGNQTRKADWDVGIAMDVVQMLDAVDIVVFVTGDGDMAPCLNYVKSRGRLAFVIGSCISYELKAVADWFLEIDESFMLI